MAQKKPILEIKSEISLQMLPTLKNTEDILNKFKSILLKI